MVTLRPFAVCAYMEALVAGLPKMRAGQVMAVIPLEGRTLLNVDASHDHHRASMFNWTDCKELTFVAAPVYRTPPTHA